MGEVILVTSLRIERMREVASDDELLQKIKAHEMTELPKTCQDFFPKLFPFYYIQDEIGLQAYAVFKMECIIIPRSLWKEMLK